MESFQKSSASCGHAHMWFPYSLQAKCLVAHGAVYPKARSVTGCRHFLGVLSRMEFLPIWHIWLFFCEFRVSPWLTSSSLTALLSWDKSHHLSLISSPFILVGLGAGVHSPCPPSPQQPLPQAERACCLGYLLELPGPGLRAPPNPRRPGLPTAIFWPISSLVSKHFTATNLSVSGRKRKDTLQTETGLQVLESRCPSPARLRRLSFLPLPLGRERRCLAAASWGEACRLGPCPGCCPSSSRLALPRSRSPIPILGPAPHPTFIPVTCPGDFRLTLTATWGHRMESGFLWAEVGGAPAGVLGSGCGSLWTTASDYPEETGPRDRKALHPGEAGQGSWAAAGASRSFLASVRSLGAAAGRARTVAVA